MKSLITPFAVLALCVGVQGQTHHKPKPSPEHVAAVKKCKADYAAATTAARSLKGEKHSSAVAKAKADEKQCIANSPK
jgi:hypothetical protein